MSRRLRLDFKLEWFFSPDQTHVMAVSSRYNQDNLSYHIRVDRDKNKMRITTERMSKGVHLEDNVALFPGASVEYAEKFCQLYDENLWRVSNRSISSFDELTGLCMRMLADV